MFSKRKKSWRTETRLGLDVEPVSQRSHIMINGVTLLGLQRTFLRFRVLVFANMMENDSEFEQRL